jgi:hypothetical protein
MAEVYIDEDKLQYYKDCEKILKQYFPDKFPDTPFIASMSSEFKGSERPTLIWIVPAYGCDFAVPYSPYPIKVS